MRQNAGEEPGNEARWYARPEVLSYLNVALKFQPQPADALDFKVLVHLCHYIASAVCAMIVSAMSSS